MSYHHFPLTEKDEAKIVRLYTGGGGADPVPVAYIAARLGKSSTQINDVLVKHGVERPRTRGFLYVGA